MAALGANLHRILRAVQLLVTRSSNILFFPVMKPQLELTFSLSFNFKALEHGPFSWNLLGSTGGRSISLHRLRFILLFILKTELLNDFHQYSSIT